MTREEILSLNEQLEVIESELQDLEDAQKNPALKKVFDFLTAETLYVQGGFTLEAIASLMFKKISAEALVIWHQEFKWDEKRNAYREQNKLVLDEAKDLVTMVLTIAKTDPSANNILSYKRAIEAAVALEKKGNTEEEENGNTEISPEKIEEFARIAGLR